VRHFVSEELTKALNAVVERLAALASQDDEFRSGLRALAQEVLRRVVGEDEPPAATEEPVAAAPESAPAEPVELPELRLRSTVEEAPSPAETARQFAGVLPVANTDLPVIEARCRLKAEGARWAAARQRRLRAGADYETEIEPKDREIIDQAKTLHDCFLWMNHPSGPSPADLSLLDDLAGCFEATASAISLVREVVEDTEANRDIFEQTLDLVAEAQSALRTAVQVIDASRDNDQQMVYRWLRRTAAEEQTFIQRYMRSDDQADPTTWSDIVERIEALDDQLQQARHQEKQRRGRLNKLRYHVQQVEAGRDTEHDWNTIVQTVDSMVKDGIPPSSREIRDALLPVIDELPEETELLENVQLVLREIDHFLATRTPAATEVDREPTTEVLKVRDRLRGKAVLLIGGERRPHAQRALQEAFGLKELRWLEPGEHESFEVFEPYVAQPDVPVILLAIRWVSHSHSNVQQFCTKYEKPLVKLPAGYSPNQVAHQIMQQCGNRLPIEASP